MPSEEVIVVYVTVPNADDACRIAHSLVEEQLAACVNILPTIRSVYRWQGQVHDESESMLIVKTRRERFEAVRARVVALHHYEIPEIIALAMVDGHAPYLHWVYEATA